MRPFQGWLWGCALAALAGGGGSAHAAWNNVFQVCCSSCGQPAPVVAAYPAAPVVAAYPAAPAVAAYGDPGCCPQPCPPTCTTRYVQRSYYQPVTSYRTTTYYQPVTSYRTSYYYEPCTSYRMSCYYDPCTCRYQQTATPVTSYTLRSRCCPVTSYLQRTCMTPVTTYQQSFYYEPVTTCCSTSTGAPVAAPPPGAPVVAAPGAAPASPPAAVPGPPPGTAETRDPAAAPPPPPGTAEGREPGSPASESRKLDRNPGAAPPSVMPRASDSSYRTPPPPPAVRFDRIASRAGHNLEGHVVDARRSPRAGARVLFVSVEGKTIQRAATADGQGAFRARLAAGGWLVYTYDGQGRPVFSRRVEVPGDRTVSMTLVNR
jgi:hypothetical protein